MDQDDNALAELTAAQERMLDFIEHHFETTCMPPTRRQIAQHFGFSSTNAAREHLRLMAKKGRIKLVPGKHRGIQLVAP